jgi:SAM-dependent methyltransferase
MSQRFFVRRLDDGSAMLNLGCGVKMHPRWVNLDFSTYARLASHPRLSRAARRIGLLSATRYERLQQVDPNIIWWDLRRGIPFPDGTFDVVYHSHMLEHIPEEQAPAFLRECRRVLKPRGVLRVVVPDLERIVAHYVAAIRLAEVRADQAMPHHREALEDLFGQMVRAEGMGTRQQRPLVRAIERRLRGSADRIGETHRWMYDRFSLGAMLADAGFEQLSVEGHCSSRIAQWEEYRLDIRDNGEEYKRNSLYMEGVRA